MSIDGRESRASTLSNLIDAFDEEKDREFAKAFESESSDSSDEDAPVDEKSDRRSDTSAKFAPKNLKSFVCKTIQEGGKCPYGLKCKFAHTEKELYTSKCSYGDDCNKIVIGKGVISNVDEKNPCHRIHPSEDVTKFLSRKGVRGFPSGDKTYKFTRMCVSYNKKIKCVRGLECTYAHDIKDLRTTPCNFGARCNNVRKSGDKYVNTGTKKCAYLHPSESLENYYNRALKTTVLDVEEVEEEEDDNEDEDDSEDDSEDEEEDEGSDEEPITKNVEKLKEVTFSVAEADVPELLTLVLSKMKIRNISVKP
jgi:Putative zinc finger protein/Zinc finger C-x8-C-x5-C-x3-H type (and similar)